MTRQKSLVPRPGKARTRERGPHRKPAATSNPKSRIGESLSLPLEPDHPPPRASFSGLPPPYTRIYPPQAHCYGHVFVCPPHAARRPAAVRTLPLRRRDARCATSANFALLGGSDQAPAGHLCRGGWPRVPFHFRSRCPGPYSVVSPRVPSLCCCASTLLRRYFLFHVFIGGSLSTGLFLGRLVFFSAIRIRSCKCTQRGAVHCARPESFLLKCEVLRGAVVAPDEDFLRRGGRAMRCATRWVLMMRLGVVRGVGGFRVFWCFVGRWGFFGRWVVCR